MALNEKQIRIAGEVVRAEKSITEIMSEEGYARESYYKWMKENKEFQDLIGQLQNEAKEAALAVIKSASVKAARLLLRAIEDGRIAKSRIDAANSILAKAGFVPELMYKDPNQPVEPERLTVEEIKEQLANRKLALVEDQR